MSSIRGRFQRDLPWWAKIGGKLLLSRLPVPYRVWKSFGLFRHGDMDEPDRSWANFVRHAETAGVLSSSKSSIGLRRFADGIHSVLELGPGDSLFTGLIARVLGASRTLLVDEGRFATDDLRRYQKMAEMIRERGYRVPGEGPWNSLEDVLRQVSAEYLVNGVKSLGTVPAASVDYCFSNAVLEHVGVADFDALATQLFRIMKPGSKSVHRVDLRDHLGGGLNNLRFRKDVWESPFFKSSGFYTNRLRFHEVIDAFERAGFQTSVANVDRWERLPIARAKLDSEFRSMPEGDLLIQSFDLVTIRRQGNSPCAASPGF